MLEVKNAVLGYTGRQKEKIVLKGLSFSLDRGELLCILGQRCGKNNNVPDYIGVPSSPWRGDPDRRKRNPKLFQRGAGQENRLCASVSYPSFSLYGF